jgi:AcrR family transcriptional regulator
MARTVKSPEERRQDFFDAAIKLFQENGYYQTSIEDLVNKVGVAKGLFYYYFKSKDDMMQKMVDELWDETEKDYHELIERDDLNAVDKLMEFSRMRRAAKTDFMFFLEVYKRDRDSPLINHLKETGYARLVPLIGSIIEQGVEEGVFDTERPREAAEFLLRGSETSASSAFKGPRELVEGYMFIITVWERVLGAEHGTFSKLIDEMEGFLGAISDRIESHNLNVDNDANG